MSERKVLNKYYPPDFDPSKIPKLRLAKERQYTVRIMAPFNMQCKLCNTYIYKGKKFNAKTENIRDEFYLGIRKFRFYIRCPTCISEIVFKTDPENEDYELENGATRLFEAFKLMQAAEAEEKKQEEEDAQNPMKVLENRTRDSKLEMEVMENLEELRELNMRQAALNHEEILRQGAEAEAERLRLQEEEDEAEIRRIFGKEEKDGLIVKRIADEEEEEDLSKPSPSYSSSNKRPTDVLTENSPDPKKQKLTGGASSSSSKSSKSLLSGLVKVKKSTSSTSQEPQLKAGRDGTSTSTTAALSSVSGTEAFTLKSMSADTISEISSDSRKVKEQRQKETDEEKKEERQQEEEEKDDFAKSIQEGLAKQMVHAQSTKSTKEKTSGLSLLGGYDFSDSDISDSASDT